MNKKSNDRYSFKGSEPNGEPVADAKKLTQ